MASLKLNFEDTDSMDEFMDWLLDNYPNDLEYDLAKQSVDVGF